MFFFRDKKTLLFVIEELLHVRAELCFFLLSLPVLMFLGTFVARNEYFYYENINHQWSKSEPDRQARA